MTSPTPPAMNAASPTDLSKRLREYAEGCAFQSSELLMVEAADELDRLAAPVGQGSDQACPNCGGSGEITALEGSGPDTYEMPANCSPCGGTGAISQGSATSGEADIAKLARLVVSAYDDPHLSAVTLDRDMSNLRAALAAKAERSNTPVPRVGGNTCDLTNYDSACNYSNGTATVVLRATTQGENDERVLPATSGSDAPAEHAVKGVGSDARTDAVTSPVAERAAAPASVPEGWRDSLDRAAWMLDIYEKHLYELQPIEIEAHPYIPSIGETANELRTMISAAQGESIDKPEFRKLSYAYAEALMHGTIPQTSAAWEALVDFCNAWGASQRQEGRRDMHETSMSVLAENCALVEKLRARDAALNWYGDEAAAIAKNLEANPRAVMASVQVLALDAGTRAVKALATPAPTSGEPSACPTCPKETPYGPAICGACVEADAKG